MTDLRPSPGAPRTVSRRWLSTFLVVALALSMGSAGLWDLHAHAGAGAEIPCADAAETPVASCAGSGVHVEAAADPEVDGFCAACILRIQTAAADRTAPAPAGIALAPAGRPAIDSLLPPSPSGAGPGAPRGPPVDRA